MNTSESRPPSHSTHSVCSFADELKEIISACPTARQIECFSATMTVDVNALVSVSFPPVHCPLVIDVKSWTARGLVQEFVRVRAERMSTLPSSWYSTRERASMT